MSDAERLTVTVREIKPYSQVSVTPAERELVLESLTEGIEELEAAATNRQQTIDLVLETRTTVDEAADLLELSVLDHDLVKSTLPDTPMGRTLEARLDRTKPACDVCGERAHQQLEIEAAGRYTVCESCIQPVMREDQPDVLNQLNPELSVEQGMTIRKGSPAPKPPVSPESEQATLDAYVE